MLVSKKKIHFADASPEHSPTPPLSLELNSLTPSERSAEAASCNTSSSEEEENQPGGSPNESGEKLNIY